MNATELLDRLRAALGYERAELFDQIERDYGRGFRKTVQEAFNRGRTRQASINKIVDFRIGKIMSERARRGAQARNGSMTPAQRIAAARHASKTRWEKKREG